MPTIKSQTAIKREGNNLIVYTSENDDISYSGVEDISDIYFGIANAEGKGGSTGSDLSEYRNKHTMLIPEDYSGNTFEAYIVNISYTIHGYWEIDFE